jgi:hypothetical protein
VVIVKPSETCLTVILIIISAIVIFRAGFDYGRQSAKFTHHEIPLKSGGVAFVVPDGWQVVTEWDKHGRPYIRPTDGESE